MTAPRIIFVNRFFYPDLSATSQILSDLAFSLPALAMRVRVITSRLRYDDPAARLHAREIIHGVKIRRVATTRFGRFWLPGRLIDFLSFYLSAGWALWRFAGRGDIVVVMTDPPLLSILAACIARRRGFTLVSWLQDVYPEIASALGVSPLNGPLGRILVRLRDAALRHSAVNVVIGDDMATRLRATVPDAAIAVLPNWTDDESIHPFDGGNLRVAWGLQDKFVVAYSGNLGRAHDIDTFLGAAEALKSRPDIVFLFIGGGHAMVKLKQNLASRGIENVQFRAYQPRAMLSHSLGVADVHWLSLKANLDGLILPSKFYGIAAAGRPIIVVSSPTMELAALVTRFDCGISVRVGDSNAFAQAIIRLADDAPRCKQIGLNARKMLDEHFTKAMALARWHVLLDTVVTRRSCGMHYDMQTKQKP